MSNHTTDVKIRARRAQIKTLAIICRRLEVRLRHAYDALGELEDYQPIWRMDSDEQGR